MRRESSITARRCQNALCGGAFSVKKNLQFPQAVESRGSG